MFNGCHKFSRVIWLQERVRNLTKIKKWDVVKLDWVKRATDEKHWHHLEDWCPWEIVSGTKTTEERLSNLFDQFRDSFANDADNESLKRSMKLAEESVWNFYKDIG